MRKRTLWIVLLIFMLTMAGCSAGPESSPQDKKAAANAAHQQELKVTYLDVGQGDSTFIELPGQRSMLIDASESEYSKKIENYIRSEGYDKIDYLIATHPHSDHIGGLSHIVATFDIGAVYMPKAQTNTRVFENLLTSVKKKKLKVKAAKAGVEILQDEDLTIRIVAPNEDQYSDLNDYSAVVYLTYGENSFLFMGDAEKKSEKEIKGTIKADVLKAGHHGSDYSSGTEFLKKVSPEYAVISCGKDNKYGHPDSETLKRLKKFHTNIFRTDEQGNIIIKSDGRNLTVSQKQAKKQEETQNQPEGAKAVYITKSGSKYHESDCSSLKSSARKTTVKKAEKEGYEPCSKCIP